MQLPSWPGALPLGTPGSCLWTDAGCPARAAPAAFPDPRVGQMQVRLRGGRQRAAVPSALPARGSAPGNPDSMHEHAKRLAHMPTGRMEQALLIQVLA